MFRFAGKNLSFNDSSQFKFAGSGDAISGTPNLGLWLDASKLGLNDGDLVQTWTDYSGNGRNAVQATSGSRPTFRVNQIGGLPALVFDGIDDFIFSTFAVLAAEGTLFLVLKDLVPGAGSGLFVARSDAGTRTYVTRQSVGTANLNYTKGNAAGISIGNAALVAAGNVACADWGDTDKASFYSNGTTIGTDVVNTLGSSGTYFTFGGLTNLGTQNAAFKLAEVIYYNRRLTATERNAITSQLRLKYTL